MLDLEGRAKNLDNMLSAISKQMRIVSGLIQIAQRIMAHARAPVLDLRADAPPASKRPGPMHVLPTEGSASPSSNPAGDN